MLLVALLVDLLRKCTCCSLFLVKQTFYMPTLVHARQTKYENLCNVCARKY